MLSCLSCLDVPSATKSSLKIHWRRPSKIEPSYLASKRALPCNSCDCLKPFYHADLLDLRGCTMNAATQFQGPVKMVHSLQPGLED